MHHIKYKDNMGRTQNLRLPAAAIDTVIKLVIDLRKEGIEYTHTFID
jgi:hypothetical protein